jgi:hypothetical protein
MVNGMDIFLSSKNILTAGDTEDYLKNGFCG